jgi:hypothetical protein
MATKQRPQGTGGRRKKKAGVPSPTVEPSSAGSSWRVYLVPLAFTLALLVVSTMPRVQANSTLAASFLAAAALLLGWQGYLFTRGQRDGSAPSLVLMGPKPQHYIQAMVQLSVFAYWGWYWRPVYDMAWLIVAQLLFAYAFDMLLSWSRRGNYVLGFGPFPIIFSINLFLWFRDDWFYLQFLMVAVGFLGKEFVRWYREGRSTHIFNPSAFSLGLFSVLLIATGTSDLTWGADIASTLRLAPNIYLFLFLTGLVVMYFFSITLVAASAAVVLFGLSALFYAVAGVPYFIDSEIPTAVFLGLHLLVTDPSTSPRTASGKLAFGVMYGLSVFGLYAVLGGLGTPTFYDKLLAVPLLNLSVRWIDQWVQRARSSGAISGWRFDLPAARANLGFMAIWIVFFGAMSATGRTDGPHTGDSLPFWQLACEEGRPTACDRLLQLEAAYCADNSGWACNAIGGHFAEGRLIAADPEIATGYFARACELRFQAGCLNLLDVATVTRSDPRSFDLRLLLREGRENLLETPEPELYERACDHGWGFACERLSRSPGPGTIGRRFAG